MSPSQIFGLPARPVPTCEADRAAISRSSEPSTSFLAEVSQHIPDKGEHLLRYYGWYSHRQRGLRAKSDSQAGSDNDSKAEEITIDRSAVSAQKSAADGPRPGSLSTWAM